VKINLTKRLLKSTAAKLIAAFLMSGAIQESQAAIYSWDGTTNSNTGGNWSITTNWNPDGIPGISDTAILDNTIVNRTVTYDSTASGSIASINFNQSTANITNTLNIQKNLTSLGVVTLDALYGTEQIIIGSTSSVGAGYIFTPSSGIILNSGGELVMTATGNGTGLNYGNTGGNSTLTIAGGTLTLAATTGTTTSTSAANTLSTGLTMTSGALNIINTTGLSDRRFIVQGNVNITGGSIATTRSQQGAGSITFTTTNPIIFNPTTFDTDLSIALEAGANQAMTTDKTLYVVMARNTGIKTITSTAPNQGIAQIQLFDANNTITNSRTTFKLGSDINLTPNAYLPAAQNFGNTHQSGRIDLGIDTANYTLDLSAGSSSGIWSPNKSTQTGVTNTVWTLTGNGAIKANAFNLAAANVTTDINSGLTLLAIGGNNTINDLSGAGIIDFSSSFKYSGSATINTPSLLTSTRNLGNVEITTGALRLASNSLGTIQNLKVSGGTLDVQGTKNVLSANVIGGTLLVNTDSTLNSASTVTVSSGAHIKVNGITGSINSSGTISGNGTIGNVVLLGGIVAPGNSPGLLTMSSLDASNGGFSFELSAAAFRGIDYDAIDVQNLLTLANTTTWSFSVYNNYAFQLNDSYDLFDWSSLDASTLDTNVVLNALPDLNTAKTSLVWDVSQFTINGTVSVIPEPHTSSLVSIALFLAFRKRKK
jgi:hypothetical protein